VQSLRIRSRRQRKAIWRGHLLPLAVAGLAAAFLLIAGGPVAERPDGMTGTWTLVFSDDFSGASLDRTKWEPNRYGVENGGDAPFSPSADDAWFSSKNVSVRDGRLALTIRPQLKTLSGKTYRFSSGVVQTEQHYLVKPPVYIEARIKVPKCDGCWPAFWTNPPNVWPPELDIFEFFGTDSHPRPSFNYHLPNKRAVGPIRYGKRRSDYRANYHIYGLFWDGYKAVPHLDGDSYALGLPSRTQITKLPQALILSLSVQAASNPAPGSQMLVDWVRVWRPGLSN
jgi:beta-glucanase (GH16 family)